MSRTGKTMTNKLTFFSLAIVTANKLALAFPPRNLPKKFRPDPSTFSLVIVVTDSRTDKQTDRQTYAGDSIVLAFAGITMHCPWWFPAGMARLS